MWPVPPPHPSSVPCQAHFQHWNQPRDCLSKRFPLGHGVSVQIIWKQVTESFGNCSGESQEAFCSVYSCASKKKKDKKCSVMCRRGQKMIRCHCRHRQSRDRPCTLGDADFNGITLLQNYSSGESNYRSHISSFYSILHPKGKKLFLFKQSPSLWNEAEKD